ncbi:MAG: hypothetical protein ACRCXY_04275 [Fusobacteriaceae bacterium]
MKKKIRVQIPSLIMETLETDSTFFKIAKERLCNEILYKFSLRFRSNYQSDLSFEDKVYLQFTLNKENQRYYEELVKQSVELSESEIVREIFSAYAIFHPSLRELNLYREKIAFISSSIKEYRYLKIDTPEGVIEGKIDRIFRCKEIGYLKIEVNEKSYYLSQSRIIS